MDTRSLFSLAGVLYDRRGTFYVASSFAPCAMFLSVDGRVTIDKALQQQPAFVSRVPPVCLLIALLRTSSSLLRVSFVCRWFPYDIN